jgi:Zn-dependent protease
MRDSIRLGRIAGVPVGLDWTVLLVAWLIAWSLASRVLPLEVPGQASVACWAAALVVAALFFASLLAHELAHAVVAGRQGLQVEGITLWLLGGVARLRGEARSPGAEALIAGVGPLTSLALAVPCLALGAVLESAEAAPLVAASASWLGRVNFIIGLFNLLPGAPLDGGRLARAVFWKLRGDGLQATVWATFLGRLLGYLLVALGCVELFVDVDLGGLWFIVLGIFLVIAAGSERRQAELSAALADIWVGDAMVVDPPILPAGLTVDVLADTLPDRKDAPGTWLVAGPDGTIVGILGTEQVGGLSPERQRTTRVSDRTTGLESLPVAAPDERLLDLLERLPDEADLRAVVRADGRIAGLVTPASVARVVEAHQGRRRRFRRPGTGSGATGDPPAGTT